MQTSVLHHDFWKGAFLGLIAGFLLFCLIALIAAGKLLRQKDIYNVDHWKLNVKVPFTTMWMNMGYWTNPDGQPIHDFEEACRALLYKVLDASKILSQATNSSRLTILDLGIGCGDQSWELARLAQQHGWSTYRYVGLTLNETQFRLASQKPYHELHKRVTTDNAIRVFSADAANPDGWAPEIKNAVESLRDSGAERWVLALDSLYHFFPSRKPTFRYAAKNLDASFMAFDLLLSDTASLKQKVIVKLLGLAMKCPAGAFVTEEEYRAQLREAGYDGGSIQVCDVTEHVFSGLASHINRQEQALHCYGISVAKYKVAGKIFGWFAASRAVKAAVVVARTKTKVT